MSISTEQSGTLSHAEDEFNDSIISDTPTPCEVELGLRQSTSTDIEAHQQSHPTRSFFSFFNFVRTSGTSRANNQDVYNNYNDNISQLEQQKQQPKRGFWKSLLGPKTNNNEEDKSNDADTTFTAFTVVDNDPSNEADVSHESPCQNRQQAWQTFKRVATSCHNEVPRIARFFRDFFINLILILITVALGVVFIYYTVDSICLVGRKFPMPASSISDSVSFIVVVECILINFFLLVLFGVLLFGLMGVCAFAIFFIYCNVDKIVRLIYNLIKGN